MYQPSAAIDQASDNESPDTRLRGNVLVVARAAWLTIFALNVVWFALAVVSQVGTIQRPCVATTCQLTPAQAESLHQLGIGAGTVAAYYVGLPALSVCASLLLALLLFLRRSNDWMALFVGLFLVYRVSSFAFGATNVNSTLVSTLILPLSLVDEIVFYGVLLLFPDGRFVPRWTWALWIAWAAQQFATTIVAPMVVVPSWVLASWGLTWPVLYLSALAVQVYRYRRVSTGRQRQQSKWVLLGFAVALGANILYWIVLPLAIPAFLARAQIHTVSLLYPVVAYPLYELMTIALPVSFFIAIQRHQLFDVDVLIKRTLIYGSLTVLLVSMYFGSVLVMQQTVRSLTGQQAWQNPLVIVLSTLVIAALVNPLRRRIQVIVDRRFYRAKYDSARTLERFASSLRSEVDLDGLHERLIDVVHETMQPALISLWLRRSERTPVEKRAVGAD